MGFVGHYGNTMQHEPACILVVSTPVRSMCCSAMQEADGGAWYSRCVGACVLAS